MVRVDGDGNENSTLGVLLGPLQTLLGANIERIATIERRQNDFYSIEIKGKDRNTWVSLKINFLHSSPGSDPITIDCGLLPESGSSVVPDAFNDQSYTRIQR